MALPLPFKQRLPINAFMTNARPTQSLIFVPTPTAAAAAAAAAATAAQIKRLQEELVRERAEQAELLKLAEQVKR
eukprot:SAG25_NODE_338_length_9538_cov_22.622630_2_plen_75_part_00